MKIKDGLLEIIKLQQELLLDLVNTWNPAVKQKLNRIDKLIAEQEQLNFKETCIQPKSTFQSESEKNTP